MITKIGLHSPTKNSSHFPLKRMLHRSVPGSFYIMIQRFLWCSDELSVGHGAVALVVFPRNGLPSFILPRLWEVDGSVGEPGCILSQALTLPKTVNNPICLLYVTPLIPSTKFKNLRRQASQRPFPVLVICAFPPCCCRM